MEKQTSISIALDVSNERKINILHKKITSILERMRQYNKEVEKANKLLREQEKLRAQARRDK